MFRDPLIQKAGRKFAIKRNVSCRSVLEAAMVVGRKVSHGAK